MRVQIVSSGGSCGGSSHRKSKLWVWQVIRLRHGVLTLNCAGNAYTDCLSSCTLFF